MPRKLSGRTAIVTGAGSGIGAAIAKLFAEEGANLVVNDVNGETAELLLASLGPGNHEAVIGDISDGSVARQVAERAAAINGRIDILINNAGVIHCADITETSEEEFDRVVRVNIKSMYLTTQAVIPAMVKQQSGAIVNVGSLSGLVGMEFDGVSTWLYSMSKSVAFQFSRSMASRYGKYGIRVNTLAPGATRTNQLKQLNPQLTPEEEARMWQETGASLTLLGRVGEPAEIAKVALFLASDDASYVTGQHVLADGGYIVR